MESVAVRLRQAIGESGGPRAFSATSGMARGTVDNQLAGRSPPSLETLNHLVELGFSPDWLLRGKGPQRAPGGADFAGLVEVSGPAAKGLVALPLYTAPRASAGGGAVEDVETQKLMAIDEGWLRRTFAVSPRDLALMVSEGESMEPTIRAGEILLFDRGETGTKLRDGIFIVRLEGAVMVKRLQMMPGRQLKITSDNTAFEPYTIPLNDGIDFAVIGRVVFVFRRL